MASARCHARIRVLCVDDMSAIRVLMRMLIGAETDMECVGEAASANHLINDVRRTRPHVLVLDVNMPGKDPIEAMSELWASVPEVSTIIYSGHHDPQFLQGAMDAGARGCVCKKESEGTIVRAIRKVAGGGTYFPLPGARFKTD